MEVFSQASEDSTLALSRRESKRSGKLKSSRTASASSPATSLPPSDTPTSEPVLYQSPMPSDVLGGRTTKGKTRQTETGIRRQVMAGPFMWPSPDARDHHAEGLESGKRRLEKWGTMGLETAIRLRGLTSSPGAFPASPYLMLGSDRAREMLAGSGRRCFELYALSGPAGSWQKTFMASLLTRAENFSTRFTVTWKAKATKRSRRLFFQLALSARRTCAIASGLWPTPNGDDANNATRASGEFQSLTRAVMFITPKQPSGGGQAVRTTKGGGLRKLGDQIAIGGQLNPTWVEWLQGYPLGWTDCADSVTPSSRKSRNCSGG